VLPDPKDPRARLVQLVLRELRVLRESLDLQVLKATRDLPVSPGRSVRRVSRGLLVLRE